jgi:hypothetical protein
VTDIPILNSPSFKGLSTKAQWLFFTALNVEKPRRCGVVDVWPKRIAQIATGTTEADVTEAALELDAAGVAYFDADTDELMFPGYLTEVTPVNNKRMMIAVVNSVEGVASHKLVGLVVHELIELRTATPDAAVWGDPRVVELMQRPAVDPSDLAPGGARS